MLESHWSKILLVAFMVAGAARPAAADGDGGVTPLPGCYAPLPGLTQVAFPLGATPPALPYPQKHQLTDEYVDLGFLFSDADADLPSAYRKYVRTPETYNVVMQSTLTNLYRVDFLADSVRQVRFVMRDSNVNSTIHRLSAFGPTGQLIMRSEYRDWLNPYAESFTMSVTSASTPIRSVVYTQLTRTGQPYIFGMAVTCLDFGAPPATPTPTRTATPVRTATVTPLRTATIVPTRTATPLRTATPQPTSTPLPPPAATAVPTPPPGPLCSEIVVEADADAWFEQSSDANKGDDSALKVQSKSGNDAFRAVVDFALPAVPAGCLFDGAELRLYAGSAKPGRVIQVQRAAAAWGEMSVNWPNQPARVGPVSSTASGSDPGWRAWTVSAQVADMYALGAAHGFVVFDQIENQDSEQTYRSRESGENVPSLIVRFRPL